MLLFGNVMGVVLMSVDEGSVPQLVLLCPPVCTPWHPGERSSQPGGGHIAKGGTLHSGEELIGDRVVEEGSVPALCSGVPWLYTGKIGGYGWAIT